MLANGNLAMQTGAFLAGATMVTTVAVIVAAGRGTRVRGGGAPKQYLQLAGQPVLAHSLRVLAAHPQIDATLVVINSDDARLY